MGDIVDETPMQIPVYTGDINDTSVKTEMKEFVLTAKSTKWVKRKVDENCQSPNPDDCLVTCLVEIPEEKISRLVVTDTSTTTSYEMETIVFKKIEKPGGYTKWFEVLCEKEINETVVASLQNRLFAEQFLDVAECSSV